MSIEVKTRITDPFEWIHEDYGDWCLLSDYSNRQRYDYLDLIYHRLADGINAKELEGKTDEELEEDYQYGFPLLIAEAFEEIARDIRRKHFIIKTEFIK